MLALADTSRKPFAGQFVFVASLDPLSIRRLSECGSGLVVGRSTECHRDGDSLRQQPHSVVSERHHGRNQSSGL